MPTEVKVESTTPTTNELETPDLFKDMAPVIHTTKKVRIINHIIMCPSDHRDCDHHYVYTDNYNNF